MGKAWGLPRLPESEASATDFPVLPSQYSIRPSTFGPLAPETLASPPETL